MTILVPCLKQQTRCIIIRDDGRRFEATNLCDVAGLSVCPRVLAKCSTGEGYELCGSTHAEANAAKLAAQSADISGQAFLLGHTWMCKECQDALRVVNVHTFHIGIDPDID